MSSSGSITLGRILTWVVVAAVLLIALRVAVTLIRATFAIALFLLLTVGPIILIGWLTLKIFKHFRDNPA